MPQRILFIAPEDEFSRKVSGRLAEAGFDVTIEDDADEAVRFMADKGAEVVLLTAGDAPARDLQLLERLKNEAPDAGIVLLESGGDVDFAMEARKRGVVGDLLIPFEITDLLEIIRAAGRKSG